MNGQKEAKSTNQVEMVPSNNMQECWDEIPLVPLPDDENDGIAKPVLPYKSESSCHKDSKLKFCQGSTDHAHDLHPEIYKTVTDDTDHEYQGPASKRARHDGSTSSVDIQTSNVVINCSNVDQIDLSHHSEKEKSTLAYALGKDASKNVFDNATEVSGKRSLHGPLEIDTRQLYRKITILSCTHFLMDCQFD